MKVKARTTYADTAKLCTNCLARTHYLPKCPTEQNYKRCGLRHNTMLCDKAKPSEAAPNAATTGVEILDKSVQAINVDLNQLTIEVKFVVDCLEQYSTQPDHRDSCVAHAKHSAEVIVKMLQQSD